MTVVNSFSSGTTIASASVNANFSDLASEVTNSLPRDGQAAMTGQMKASSGSVSAPGISFGSDADTGFYRSGSGAIGVASDGANVATLSSTGIDADGLSVGGAAVYYAGGTDVPVADGGTGASTASGARDNLGLGTAASPQFTAVNIGHASDTTVTRVSAGLIAVEGSNVLMASNIASQATMETGTSTTDLVAPGRQHFHPGHPKAWCRFNGTGTAAIATSYGVSSLTDGGTGNYTVNLSVTFSSANYTAVMGGTRDGTGTNVGFRETTTLATTSVAIRTSDSGAVADDHTNVAIACFGDL